MSDHDQSKNDQPRLTGPEYINDQYPAIASGGSPSIDVAVVTAALTSRFVEQAPNPFVHQRLLVRSQREVLVARNVDPPCQTRHLLAGRRKPFLWRSPAHVLTRVHATYQLALLLGGRVQSQIRDAPPAVEHLL